MLLCLRPASTRVNTNALHRASEQIRWLRCPPPGVHRRSSTLVPLFPNGLAAKRLVVIYDHSASPTLSLSPGDACRSS
jgi:hypothetical protein